MSLRLKTLLTVLVVLICLVAVLFILAQTVLLRSYVDLENRDTLQNVQRVLNALNAEIKRIETANADYARWDESYKFVQELNEDYINAELIDDFFVNLQINLMVFLNTAGQVVYAKAVDLSSGAARAPIAGLDKHLSSRSPLARLPDPAAGVSGIIMTDEGPMLVTARPIRDSKAQLPPRGMLVFGAFLDETRVQNIAAALDLPVTVAVYGDASLPPDVTADLSLDQPLLARPLDDALIAGYALIADLYGQPALVAQVELPREVYTQGQTSVTVFGLALVAAGLVFSGLMMLVLERGVLSRLTRLSHNMEQISQGGNLAGRVEASGSDELAGLARDINTMLAGLERSQYALREQDLRLRAIVKAAPILLWATDRDGCFTQLDGKGLEKLGLDATHALGKPAAEFFRSVPQIVEEIRRALAGDEFSSVLVIKDSSFDARYLPLRGLDGAISGMVGVATDITERVMAEEALGEASEALSERSRQLERAQQLLRSTLEQVSDTVKRGAPKEELTEYIEFVQTQFDRLD